jgi:hypothetical protein
MFVMRAACFNDASRLAGVRYLKEDQVNFRLSDYSPDVVRLLEREGGGTRPMALAPKNCVSSLEARTELKTWKPRELFPGSRCPEGAMAGLYLYFSCTEEAHAIAQELKTVEGSFWHGIVHRQEPDAFNAGYWFGRVKNHAVFPALRDEAQALGYDAGARWDPLQFIDCCEEARVRPGSAEEQLAMRVQLVEWQLLFGYCSFSNDLGCEIREKKR